MLIVGTTGRQTKFLPESEVPQATYQKEEVSHALIHVITVGALLVGHALIHVITVGALLVGHALIHVITASGRNHPAHSRSCTNTCNHSGRPASRHALIHALIHVIQWAPC